MADAPKRNWLSRMMGGGDPVEETDAGPDELQLAVERIEHLEEELKVAKSRAQKLKRSRSKLEEALEASRLELDQARAEAARLTDLVASKEQERAAAEHRAHEARAEASQLDDSLLKAKANLAEEEERATMWHRKCASFQRELTTARRAAEEATERDRRRSQSLERSLGDAQARADEQQARADELESRSRDMAETTRWLAGLTGGFMTRVFGAGAPLAWQCWGRDSADSNLESSVSRCEEMVAALAPSAELRQLDAAEFALRLSDHDGAGSSWMVPLVTALLAKATDAPLVAGPPRPTEDGVTITLRRDG